MSVFKSIKGTLNTAQQGISAKWKSLSGKEEKEKKPIKLKAENAGVNLDAGADLLNKFQVAWMEIHQEAEVNAQKAEVADSAVTALYLQHEKQNEELNQLLGLVAGLPVLLEDLGAAMARIGEMESSFSELETLLMSLEDLCEANEMADNKVHHERQLSMYAHKRKVEFEQVKVKLAGDHAKKVAAYEGALQERLRERSQVFEDTFAQEIQNYKSTGTTQLKPRETGGTLPVNLSQISLDEDRTGLDDFLKDNEAGAVNSIEEEVHASDEDDKDMPMIVAKDEDIEDTDNVPPQNGANKPQQDDNKNQIINTESQAEPKSTEKVDNDVKESGAATESTTEKVDNDVKESGAATESTEKVDKSEQEEDTNSNENKTTETK